MSAEAELYELFGDAGYIQLDKGNTYYTYFDCQTVRRKITAALSEAHAKGFEDCRLGLSELDDDELAKCGLMRLPRDFDDVPIRVGDKMQSVGYPHEPAHEVIAVGNGCFILDNDETCIKHADAWWHYKQSPSVQDLLYEMYGRLDEPSGDDQSKTAEEIIAEYVDRLQLREE